jgi:N-acetyl-gamma-glutamyl-phosphate reductase
MKTKVAIVGAAGYAGEELLRLLSRHPHVEIVCITSRSNAGQSIAKVFPKLADLDLQFVQPDTATIAESADAAFLALPHGLAAEYAVPLLKAGVKLLDISADFRLRSLDDYENYYGEPHPAPQLLDSAVYGLPEKNRSKLAHAALVACPGCYPTSIILPTAAVLAAGLASPQGITVCSMSGVSGAGRKASLPFLFAECNESLRPYNVVRHRHLPEIEQELADSAQTSVTINFIPHLVPVTRGIHSTIVLNAVDGVDPQRIQSALQDAYGDEPFVRVLPHGSLADTKNVTMTNSCEIGFDYDPRNQRIILSSAIDNLTKGASGQAIQCMNVMFGYPETTGLI